MRHKPDVYPFCAIVGQDRARKALLLHAVNPLLQGVLLTGAPGTAKTTLVRGVSELLPDRTAIGIPLHVDEERLFGGLDVAHAIRSGERRTVAGLLAEADGQVVTIDDADRLPEKLLGAILSTAESGSCEGGRMGALDLRPSRFWLYGTMSAGDGKPVPGMIGRWGLYVRLDTVTSPDERAEIVRRVLTFQRDPDGFRRTFEQDAHALRMRLAKARERLSSVHIGDSVLQLAAEVAGEAGCAGHRADLLLVETARAIAAWEGLSEATAGHLREAAGFVLPHRMREAPAHPGEAAGNPPAGDRTDPASEGQQPASEGQGPDETDDGASDRPSGGGRTDHEPSPGLGRASSSPASGEDSRESGDDGLPGSEAEARAIVEEASRPFDVRHVAFAPPSELRQPRAGKRNEAGAGSRTGRYVRAAIPRGPVRDLAFDATIRAAAPYQQLRRARSHSNGDKRKVRIEPSDLRVKVRESRIATAILFVVDASGSMNAAKRMKAVKGAVLSLLRDAYRQRDSVGLISFREKGAELMLDITRSVELAERKLSVMPVGGKTPLAAGLHRGLETIQSVSNQGSGVVPAMIVITDGKANVGAGTGTDPWQECRAAARRIAAAGVRALVIDSEQGFVRLGYARKLAEDMRAQYCRLDDLAAERIERAVRAMI